MVSILLTLSRPFLRSLGSTEPALPPNSANDPSVVDDHTNQNECNAVKSHGLVSACARTVGLAI